MFWSHHGGHHWLLHDLLFDYCLLHCSTDLFEALRKLIENREADLLIAGVDNDSPSLYFMVDVSDAVFA